MMSPPVMALFEALEQRAKKKSEPVTDSYKRKCPNCGQETFIFATKQMSKNFRRYFACGACLTKFEVE